MIREQEKMNLGEGQLPFPFLLDFPAELLSLGENVFEGCKVIRFQGRFDVVQAFLKTF